MFVQIIPFELLNLLLPNLAWWCTITSQIVFQKDWFAVFMVKVTIKDHIIKVSLSYISSEVLILWQLSLVRWRIIIKSGLSCEKKLDYCVQDQGHSEGSRFSCLSRWYLLNQQAFCFQTWYYDASSWVGVSCKKINLLLSRSRSLRELIWSKFDNFYCIFWTAGPFATKLDLMVHCHKSECFMEKWECCVQGQGHSKFQNFNECFSRWYLLNH